MLTNPLIAMPSSLLIAALFIWVGSLDAVKFYRSERKYTLDTKTYQHSFFFTISAAFFTFFGTFLPIGSILGLFDISVPGMIPELSFGALMTYAVYILLIMLLTIFGEWILRKCARKKEPFMHFANFFWVR